MADGVFNVAKGRVNEFVNNVVNNNPANSAIVVVALQQNGSFPSDDALGDLDTLSAVLGDANVDEATFTNYARIINTDTELSAPTVDDTGNEQFSDIPDLVYTDAGGTLDNTLQKIVVCYDPDTTGGTDADLIPLTHHDVTVVTDGSTVTIAPPTNGFYGAT